MSFHKSIFALVFVTLAGFSVANNAYRSRKCFYEVTAQGDTYLLTDYVPACTCKPDPATKDCTCETSEGPGKCTLVHCFAIDSPFFLLTKNYYLDARDMHAQIYIYDRGNDYGGPYAYWDYQMNGVLDGGQLDNPCEIPPPPEPSFSSSSESSSSASLDSEGASGTVAIVLPLLLAAVFFLRVRDWTSR